MLGKIRHGKLLIPGAATDQMPENLHRLRCHPNQFVMRGLRLGGVILLVLDFIHFRVQGGDKLSAARWTA